MANGDVDVVFSFSSLYLMNIIIIYDQIFRYIYSVVVIVVFLNLKEHLIMIFTMGRLYLQHHLFELLLLVYMKSSFIHNNSKKTLKLATGSVCYSRDSLHRTGKHQDSRVRVFH